MALSTAYIDASRAYAIAVKDRIAKEAAYNAALVALTAARQVESQAEVTLKAEAQAMANP